MLVRMQTNSGGGSGGGDAVMIAQNSIWYASTIQNARNYMCNKDVNSEYVTQSSNELTFIKNAKIVVYVLCGKYPGIDVRLNNTSKGSITSQSSDNASQLMVNLDVSVGDVLKIEPTNVSYGGENVIGCVVMAIG